MIVTLVVLAAIVGVTIWARQEDAARRVAEGRADVAETELVAAQASLTAIANASAAATATAAAEANEPEQALTHALDLVFEAYKDPNEGKLRALSDAFSPDALSFERTEAEHLISGGLHLAGDTPYAMEVLSSEPGASADDAQITTHEVWTYDELDTNNRKVRCVVEESDQTYDLHHVAAGWLVNDVTLQGTPHRTDC
jgi:hypothetical protein